eukprot:128265-Prorocentrum_minimum.AAC.1
METRMRVWSWVLCSQRLLPTAAGRPASGMSSGRSTPTGGARGGASPGRAGSRPTSATGERTPHTPMPSVRIHGPQPVPRHARRICTVDSWGCSGRDRVFRHMPATDGYLGTQLDK